MSLCLTCPAPDSPLWGDRWGRRAPKCSALPPRQRETRPPRLTRWEAPSGWLGGLKELVSGNMVNNKTHQTSGQTGVKLTIRVRRLWAGGGTHATGRALTHLQHRQRGGRGATNGLPWDGGGGRFAQGASARCRTLPIHVGFVFVSWIGGSEDVRRLNGRRRRCRKKNTS